MATKILSTDKFEINVNDQHPKISCLIWLNNDLNDPEIGETEQKLNSIINNMKKFENVSICKNYIEKQSQNDRLVIIVSGQLGREIVPSIHMLQSVVSIYVYCMDTTSNKQWSHNFAKVKDVVDDLDELIFRIKIDYETQKMAKKPLPIKFFTASSDGNKSTTDVNGHFIWSQVFIDCLLRLKSTRKDINELIERCKNEYEGNDFELNNLREFGRSYSPNKSLFWYTRDSFFYKTLYTVLCTENIHMTFLFRRFISDIQRQLSKYQVKQPLQVYRSQMMSNDQLQTLKANCGQFISVNTFLSTSTDKQRALSFTNASDATDNLKLILFEIDADPTMVTTKPFADISPQSEFPGEPEILFMIGSIFRLKSVHRSNHGQLWIIQLVLCNDNDQDLKTVFMYSKKELGNGETNLETLGKLFRKIGKIDLAEQYFTRLVEQLPSNDPLLCDLYEDLSELASQTDNYDMSVQWHQKSVALKTEAIIPSIAVNAKWTQNGITVAGGQGLGNALNRLWYPHSLFLDDNQMMIIADTNNHRVIQWKVGDTDGKIVAGGRGEGKRLDQLCFPTDVLIDKETNTLIICDQGNRRVVRWPCRSGPTQGEIFLENIFCRKLVMDDQRYLYISDAEKNEVRRYQIGDKNGTLIAGGHGRGDSLNQLNMPADIFVDREHTVYVSDEGNHRVLKWKKDAMKGIVVAGGQGQGKALTHLSHPNGLFVDALDTVYVTDSRNNRVVRWLKDETQGTVIVGENGEGEGANQFNGPLSLFFDRNGHLYVVDMRNHRVQRFSIE